MANLYYAPGRYRILVAGRVEPRLAPRLGGLFIVARERPGEEPRAELTGHLADQAALYGVLNTLYDHHFPLLSVEYLGPGDDPELIGE